MNNNPPIDIVVCVSPPMDERPAGAPWRFLGELELRAVELARFIATQEHARTTAVSVGPPEPTSNVLAECLARGIDRAVRVGDEWVEDGFIVAACLAEALRSESPNLVICAQRSASGAHGVVPAALADRMGLPILSNVVGLEIDWAQRVARATQMLERGARWHWSAVLPAVCAVERDVITPRYLAVRRFARARSLGGMTSVVANIVGAAAEIERGFGLHTVESRGPARIRPKKAKAPPKKMSAADRMKFLRGGQTGQESGNDGPRTFAGSPDEAAREILALLTSEEQA
jgi:electron transfer flavoprotein alpha/beta subunit